MSVGIALIFGIVAGIILGTTFCWLWWRAKFATVSARSEAVKSETVHAITQASAKAAAEQALLQFRQVEANAAHAATEDLVRRQDALKVGVEELVKPVRDQLAQYQQQVESLQRNGSQMHGELKSYLEQLASANASLQQEAHNLVTALRKPDVRGSWGEQTLHRIIELAGMVEHCDFDTQVHMTDSFGARQRPDVVIHLPNSRTVIVDAKVPLEALLDGVATEDKLAKEAAIARHASQLRAHVDGLAKRAYWQGHEGSVDFVVAFIPSDPLLGAAYEHDPSIFEYALARHVIIATPTTLIALLKAISYGWQQEAATKNAQEVVVAGRELYVRVRTMVDHVVNLGQRLRLSVDAYNKFVGSLESRVVPQAKRFEQLEIISAAESGLGEPAVLTDFPRELLSAELVATPDSREEF